MTTLARTIISIGYGRHFFKVGNVERARMEICAKEVNGLHMVIFTSVADGLSVTEVSNGLTLYPTNSKARFLMPVDAFFISRRLLKKYNRDTILNVQDPFEAGLVGLLLKYLYRVPLIVQEHGDVLSTLYWRRESLGNFFRYFLGFFVLRRADSVRVVSSRTRQALQERGIKPITLLPVAIDTSAFLSAQPDTATRSLFEPGTFIFLTVARFVQQKNLLLLVQAFKVVYEKNKNVRLLIVGTGPDEKLLKEYINTTFQIDSGEMPIVILPWSNNVPGMMKAADAYVLTSNYEGWGRVLIEAMVCALPIVTTDVGCAGEVVKDIVHGLVVPVDDAKQLSVAMSTMAEDTHTYSVFVNNLKTLSLAEIPGTNLTSYGVEWARSLRSSL